jgi:NADPH:quinone reductase-like Zn-dependent oxidoreductase
MRACRLGHPSKIGESGFVPTNICLTIPEPGRVELVERPYPTAKLGSVVLEQAIAPICAEDRIWTDHHHQWADNPYSLGHEGVGTVHYAPEGSALTVGDRVIVLTEHPDPAAPGSSAAPGFFVDGLSPLERRNDSESGWGAMATYRLVDEQNCYVLPDDLDFRYAAAGNCLLGLTYNTQEMLDVTPGDRLLVLGNGQRSQSLSHVVHGLYRSATVIAAVEDDYQADMIDRIATVRGGTPALHIVDLRDPGWKQRVRHLTDADGPDQVIEMTGDTQMMQIAIKLVAHDGRIAIAEHLRGDRAAQIDPYADIAGKNLQILGDIDTQILDPVRLIRMLRNREVQAMTDVLITHEFPMSQAAQALDLKATHRVGKIYLYPGR